MPLHTGVCSTTLYVQTPVLLEYDFSTGKYVERDSSGDHSPARDVTRSSDGRPSDSISDADVEDDDCNSGSIASFGSLGPRCMEDLGQSSYASDNENNMFCENEDWLMAVFRDASRECALEVLEVTAPDSSGSRVVTLLVPNYDGASGEVGIAADRRNEETPLSRRQPFSLTSIRQITFQDGPVLVCTCKNLGCDRSPEVARQFELLVQAQDCSHVEYSARLGSLAPLCRCADAAIDVVWGNRIRGRVPRQSLPLGDNKAFRASRFIPFNAVTAVLATTRPSFSDQGSLCRIRCRGAGQDSVNVDFHGRCYKVVHASTPDVDQGWGTLRQVHRSPRDQTWECIDCESACLSTHLSDCAFEREFRHTVRPQNSVIMGSCV